MINKADIFSYIFIFFIICIILKIYKESEYFQLTCIVSDVDGNKYCIRETNKLELVADLLANMTQKLIKIVKHLKKKYPSRPNCQRLKNFNPKKIVEILPTSTYTAYTENKGEKLAFCTTKEKGGGKLIDENTLTFVALHELSHIMTESVGHTPEFWNNFTFVLKEAVNINIYKPVDYKIKPVKYCGMKITDNPYYDY